MSNSFHGGVFHITNSSVSLISLDTIKLTEFIRVLKDISEDVPANKFPNRLHSLILKHLQNCLSIEKGILDESERLVKKRLLFFESLNIKDVDTLKIFDLHLLIDVFYNYLIYYPGMNEYTQAVCTEIYNLFSPIDIAKLLDQDKI